MLSKRLIQFFENANWQLCRLAFSCAFLLVSISWCSVAVAQRSPIAEREALPHVSWQDAEKVVEQIAVVSGKIVNTGATSDEKVNFLNFDRRRDVFKIVIFGTDLDNFSAPLKELYENKLISVRGEVSLYRGLPQIRVRSPDQIQFIRRLPATKLPKKFSRTPGRQIRVGTFNVRNLFDGVDDPYHLDETTDPKPREEIERLAQTIRKMDCDVLGLQEVESRGYLQRFNDVMLAKLGYEVVHYAGNDRRGSGLAVLTRVPVGSVTSHRHRRFPNDDGELRRFSRDLLCVELTPTGREPFEVWVTHLKSKRGGAEITESQRVAEAGEIRRQIESKLKKDPSARIVVVGDFNDTKDSRPLKRLVGTGPTKLETFWHMLPADTVTYTLEPYRSLIDHLLCSPGAAKALVPESYRVLNLSLSTSGSDHNPLVADFEF